MRRRDVERFVKWLEASAPRGRSMRQYVETFGALSPRGMIEGARDLGVEVVTRTKYTKGGFRMRLYITRSRNSPRPSGSTG